MLDALTRSWRPYVLIALVALSASLPGFARLPVTDRDEARFAQATRQMLETGDFIRINVQDEPRHKKPIGIHWMQAATVSAAAPIAGEPNTIWPYRIPSLLGIVLAALATFWAGLALVGRNAAFVGAALFAATLIATTEGLIAKTDGMLAGLTTLALATLARLRVTEHNPKKLALLFWFALGLGVLVKGPVTPMIAGLTLLTLGLWERRAQWMKPLLWWPGPVLAVLLVLPWFIAIQIATGGEFIREAFFGDLAPKMTGGQEGHWGFPGYHLALLFATFFPATLGLIPAAMLAWKTDRRAALLMPAAALPSLLFALGALAASLAFPSLGEAILDNPPAMWITLAALLLCALIVWRVEPRPVLEDEHTPARRFLIAWIVPSFLVFEFLPTKLAHYVLPTFPALALLAAAGLFAARENKWRASPAVSFVLFALGAVFLVALNAFAVTLMPGDEAANTRRAVQTLIMGGAGVLIVLVLMILFKSPPVRTMLAILVLVVSNLSLRERILPEARTVLISAELDSALDRAGLHDAPLTVIGYRESSLAFHTRTDARLLPEQEWHDAALHIAPDSALIVICDRTAGVETDLAGRQLRYAISATITGQNYANGDDVCLNVGAVRANAGASSQP